VSVRAGNIFDAACPDVSKLPLYIDYGAVVDRQESRLSSGRRVRERFNLGEDFTSRLHDRYVHARCYICQEAATDAPVAAVSLCHRINKQRDCR